MGRPGVGTWIHSFVRGARDGAGATTRSTQTICLGVPELASRWARNCACNHAGNALVRPRPQPRMMRVWREPHTYVISSGR